MFDLINNNLFWFLIVPGIVFVIYGAVIYLMDREKHLTISQCVSKTKLRSLIFALIIGLGSIPIYLTLILWLGPSRDLSIWYYVAVLGAMIGQIILLVFPHKKDSFRVHNVGANLWSYMVVVICLTILFSGKTTLVERIFLIQFIVSGVIISIILFPQKFGRFTFAAEAFGLVNWAVTLLVLAF